MCKKPNGILWFYSVILHLYLSINFVDIKTYLDLICIYIISCNDLLKMFMNFKGNRSQPLFLLRITIYGALYLTQRRERFFINISRWHFPFSFQRTWITPSIHNVYEWILRIQEGFRFSTLTGMTQSKGEISIGNKASGKSWGIVKRH